MSTHTFQVYTKGRTMSFSVSYTGNGTFTMIVDGKSQTLNLADLNTMVRMEQVEQYDQGIADQLGEIQRTNQKRKTLNALLSKLRDHKSRDAWGDGGKFSLPGESGSKHAHEWITHFGVTYTQINTSDSTKKRAQWDSNISAVKTQIDNITSDSEMQMLRFRQMVDRRGTALQEAKTTLSNDKRLKDAILQG